MDWPEHIVTLLRNNGLHSISFVPDGVIARIVAAAANDPVFHFTAPVREEEGVGILTGQYLGGRRGVLMMQSAGMGNCINALASLAIPYQVPFLLLISQRGELGEFNACHAVMGRSLRPTLDALGIQHFTVERETDLDTILNGAIKTAFATEQPVAVILSTALVGWKDDA